MKNWKTNLGGAISITGTSLLGVGILPQLSQLSPATANTLSPHQLGVLWYTALIGFILIGLGKGIAFLFAADADVVNNVAKAVDKINAEGPSPFAPPAVTKTETPKQL